MEIKKLLVTTDLSELSTAVFETAAYEAKMKGAKINLVHVIGPPTQYYPSEMEIGFEGILSEHREQEKEAINKKMNEFAKKNFHGLDVEVSILNYEGSEAELIAKHAKANKCDAIMIASAGRGALGQVFIGSTVLRLLQFAHCPVIVIPVHKA